VRLAPAADTTAAVRLVPDSERRARLALRHRLAPAAKAPDVLAAADGVVCLHATDPATIALSAWARVNGFRTEDLDDALYDERSLVKHLSMRRTLFVFPRATLPAAQAAASARVAATERKRLIGDVERAGLHADGAAWLDAACDAVRAALADGRTAMMAELRRELPLLEGGIAYGEGKSWGATVPVGPRVLTVLSASGELVRATNAGGWAVSRPRWAAMRRWLGEPIAPLSFADGTAALVRRWLHAFGPGTEADVKWWLGSTLRAVRGALSDLDAVEVELERGGRGWLLPDDLDEVAAPAPWAALLPPLDPTTMGWQERAFYLGGYRPLLFDTAGNGGATAWWDGRIVGGWRQRDDGSVELQYLDDPGADGRAALQAEAERLSDWFGGVRVLGRFPSPLSKQRAG
jgi:hypothetical protein